MTQEDPDPVGYRNHIDRVTGDSTCPGKRVRLNYPSEQTGGAREDCEANEVFKWVGKQGSGTAVATRLIPAGGMNAAGPLCEII